MSDENRGAPGTGDETGDTTRVGTAERDNAVALLGEHWRAGRLDPAEHELRVTRARAAVTQADLDILFADLPQAGLVPSAGLERTAAADLKGAEAVAGGSGFMAGKRDTIMALTPFAALFLFFVTGSWLWFLAIPVMGILLFGPEGKKSRRGDQKGR